jgi:hypothetical protein
MCRLLQVSRSAFYAWRDRPMCARQREDLALAGKIAAIHRVSRENYGSPMIHAELADAVTYGRQQIAMSMANDEQSPTEQKGRADWTGLIIVALLAPLFFFSIYLGKAEMGFTACVALGMVILAIKLRWNLRRHAWFWVTIALILALQIPFLFIVRWAKTNIPTIVFSLPLGIADFLLISAAISLAEKLFSKGHSVNEDDG